MLLLTCYGFRAEPEPVYNYPNQVVQKKLFLENEQEFVSSSDYSKGSDEAEICDLKQLGIFRVTAYCSCEKCCGKWANLRSDGIVYGASGEELIPFKSIAVDTSVIQYGETVFIDGKEYVAHDCGAAIRGNKIDIYMNDHQAAIEWGVQELEVYKKE